MSIDINDDISDDIRREARRNLSSDARRKFLEEAHERAVLRANSKTAEEFLRRRKEQPRVENEPLEVRLEHIEKRLEMLELKQ